MLTASQLMAFTERVKQQYLKARIHSPVHFCGGNEDKLIELFQRVPRDAWVFSAWRSHYHALLHGVPEEELFEAVMAGHSLNVNFKHYKFFSSAIVGGILPIACGVAAMGNPVWCFVGDMTASIGAFRDAQRFAQGHNLPVVFVIEDNGLATNTPTEVTWGEHAANDHTSQCRTLRYYYTRTYPHVGLEERVQF